MANLADLHDAAILHNLHLRYKSDKIYVSCCQGHLSVVAHTLISQHVDVQVTRTDVRLIYMTSLSDFLAG